MRAGQQADAEKVNQQSKEDNQGMWKWGLGKVADMISGGGTAAASTGK